MPKPSKPEKPSLEVQPTVLPQGELLKLKPSDIIPSRNNPRLLFDRPQLDELKNNIRQHGVLVPITVFQQKASKKFTILDGARRHRCCLELEKENVHVEIPANVVVPPTKIAGTLYMFSIHNFREAWELMPTALALHDVMEELGEKDNKKLKDLTGLSEPQIERCKTLLRFDEKYQNMSLDPDSTTRIPSNFWIELTPVLDVCEADLPRLYKSLSRDGITDKLVEKYRAKRIKSVIHFRRIIEAIELNEGERRNDVVKTLEKYILDTDIETRKAFDPFSTDLKRVNDAIGASDEFVAQIKKLKIEHSTDKREEVIKAFQAVQVFIGEMIEKLKGGDEPDPPADED